MCIRDSSYPYSYQHCGVMSIYAGLNGENLQETLEVTLDELDQLRMGRFTEGEFARSREQMKGNYILGLDSPSNRMMGMGKGMLLYQRIHTETEVLRRINRVTRESVVVYKRQRQLVFWTLPCGPAH